MKSDVWLCKLYSKNSPNPSICDAIQRAPSRSNPAANQARNLMGEWAAHVCNTGRQIGLAGCLGQSLIQVGHQIIGILDPDRQTHDAWTRACGFLLLGSQLAVRGAG